MAKYNSKHPDMRLGLIVQVGIPINDDVVVQTIEINKKKQNYAIIGCSTNVTHTNKLVTLSVTSEADEEDYIGLVGREYIQFQINDWEEPQWCIIGKDGYGRRSLARALAHLSGHKHQVLILANYLSKWHGQTEESLLRDVRANSLKECMSIIVGLSEAGNSEQYSTTVQRNILSALNEITFVCLIVTSKPRLLTSYEEITLHVGRVDEIVDWIMVSHPEINVGDAQIVAELTADLGVTPAHVNGLSGTNVDELLESMRNQMINPSFRLRSGELRARDFIRYVDSRIDRVRECIRAQMYAHIISCNMTIGFLLHGLPGCGKCLDPYERVIMYDGTLKEAQDVIVGDLLMGDDSTPREVLSICSGEDEMFRVIPCFDNGQTVSENGMIAGESYIVNSQHILTLASIPRIATITKENRYKVLWHEGGKCRTKTFTGLTPKMFKQAEKFRDDLCQERDIIDMPIGEYMAKSKSWKTEYKGYRTSANWPEQEVEIDPYILGIWLGDGEPQITNIDKPIIDELCKQGLQMNRYKNRIIYGISGKWQEDEDGKITRLAFLNSLRNLNVLNNKHIPLCYKANSEEVRLEVLAGLMDSDGYMYGNCFETGSKKLANDITFLARSLGFYVSIKKCKKRLTRKIPKESRQQAGTSCNEEGTVFTRVEGTYHRMIISGHTDKIPVRLKRKKAGQQDLQYLPSNSANDCKDASVFGFTIESLGQGPYAGFTVTDNGRFLLKDFTVTHNSYIAKILGTGCRYREGLPYLHEAQELWRVYGDDAPMYVILLDECEKMLSEEGDKAVFLRMTGTTDSPRNLCIIATTNSSINSIPGAIWRHGRLKPLELPSCTAKEITEYAPKFKWVDNIPFTTLIAISQACNDKNARMLYFDSLRLPQVVPMTRDERMKWLENVPEQHSIKVNKMINLSYAFLDMTEDCSCLSIPPNYTRYVDMMYDSTFRGATVIPRLFAYDMLTPKPMLAVYIEHEDLNSIHSVPAWVTLIHVKMKMIDI